MNKPKIILFIASSLDGFIAKENGGIDWLFSDNDYGYKEFYNSIGSILIGAKTYRQALTFGEYPFKDKKVYVFTRQPNLQPVENELFIDGNIIEFTRKLKEKRAKNIWLVGGGEINGIMLEAGLIDEVIISVHPVVLGKGIPLFSNVNSLKKMKFVSMESYPSGLVQMKYVLGH